MAGALGMIALFLHLRNGIVCMIFMSMFQVAYQITMNAVHWVYVPEILSDTQFGFVATIHYLNGVELALVSEYMIEYMRPEGTFLFYASITFIGLFFFMYLVKETSGLSDKQKKQLYFPKNFVDSSEP